MTGTDSGAPVDEALLLVLCGAVLVLASRLDGPRAGRRRTAAPSQR